VAWKDEWDHAALQEGGIIIFILYAQFSIAEA
jgi:hypothetical protein